MGVGAGIFLIALGAILRFAITADLEGVSLEVIGNILMLAGIAVALLSLFFYVVSSSRRTGGRVVEEWYVDDRPVSGRI
jgi:hypothetical protein